MVEFTDIRIRAALPLHPYLAKHPRISLRLVADKNVCGETPGVNGDLVTGVWTFDSTLSALAAKKSLTIAVMTGENDPRIQLVSVTVKMAELLARVDDRANGCQDFDIFDSSAPLQLRLFMTCTTKSCPILVRPSQAVGDRDPTNDNYCFAMDLSSRRDLETSYAWTIRMSDRDDNKAHALNQLGCAYYALYEEERARTDLEKAISLHEEAMQFTSSFHAQWAEHAQCLAIALIERFQESGDPVDTERAIAHCRTALKYAEDSDADKPDLFDDLGSVFWLRFERMGELADMESAISCYRRAVEVTPDGHPDKPSQLSNLGNALRSRFKRLGSVADIDDAILNQQRAVEFTPDGHPDKPDVLNNLGTALKCRFDRLGSVVDIDNAISNLHKAVEFTPDGHPGKLRQLNNLGEALRSRFERFGSVVDINDAVSNLQKAVKFTPDSDPGKPTRFNNLGAALQCRFRRLRNIADIDDAILNQQRAVEFTPDGHPDKPDVFNNLGAALQCRFDRFSNIVDIDDAISNLHKAIEFTPDGHPDKPGRLSNLGGVLQCRFERLGSLADIDEAISNQQKAVNFTPDGHPDKLRRLSNLGGALRRRFERLGSLADIDDSISIIQRAVEFTPDGHPSKSSWLSSLGAALQMRFDRLGSVADIDDAISNQKKAVKLMPDGHPGQPGLLGNLGNALQSRFEHFGSVADIDNAILNQQMAVEFTPDGDPYKPPHLSSLGSALHSRFQRLGGLADIDDAISNQEKAVKFTPDGHPDKPRQLSNLGGALQCRFERLGSLADINESISNQQKAVNFTPDGHPDKLSWLSNLGCALQRRFERLGSLADIDEAILYYRKAVDLVPDGHPGRPGRLHNLGAGFLARFRGLGVLSDLECALSVFSTAAKSTSGSAIVRFKAARWWAKSAEEHSRSSLDAFSCAIDLLPQIAWLGLAVTDQHALLADVGGIVRDAVAAAIRYEEYEIAVVWAEQGRSIVWQNLLGLRSPVDDLRQGHPRLADRLQSIARQLEGSASHVPLGNDGQAVPVEDLPRGYSKLAVEWANLIDEIRSIPNFEGFLRTKSFSQLAAAANEGPVVILNVSDSQCDALVLVAEDSAERRVSVVNIPLERFSYDKSKQLFQNLTGLLASAGVRERNDRKTGRAQSQADGDAKFKIILRILWQDVVKPVVEGLAFQTQSNRPPRIWWCATGPLAFLPIHAAGLYDTQEIGEKASDYVVSSYTPTLTAILDLSEPVVQEDFQVLIVAQASAPGAPPIPKTEDEVQIIHRLATGARRMSLTRENATVERVREGMMNSNWIHLACHGQQNPDDPMESGFLLHDKILKLSEIVKMSLPKADFAFLSACQTAMGDERVAEESAHLAAGMLLSGCRGVIATTWSIRDGDAPKIAEDVYSRIFKDGKPNRKEAAYALDEAVRRLRESGTQCMTWVPFIHIGR